MAQSTVGSFAPIHVAGIEVDETATLMVDDNGLASAVAELASLAGATNLAVGLIGAAIMGLLTFYRLS